jgi:accessory gene regulator B
MIESTAGKMADWIHRNSENPAASKEVLKYALSIYLNGFAIVLVSSLFGLVTGTLLNTWIAMISFSALRAFSGGNHFPSAMSCFLFSVAAFALIVHVPSPSTPWIQYALLITSLIMALLYAPNTNHDPIEVNKLSPYMKWISVAIVSTNFFFMSWVVTLAFFIQCISLIPLQRR